MTKFTTQLFCLATLAMGIAHAAPYDVTLFANLSVGKTQLKAGDYTVEMKGDKAVFKCGKKTVEVLATLERTIKCLPPPFSFRSIHSCRKSILAARRTGSFSALLHRTETKAITPTRLALSPPKNERILLTCTLRIVYNDE